MWRSSATGSRLSGSSATRRRAGKVVTPGFIDIHARFELPLLVDGRARSKVMQGVTLEVVGNCGTSPGPWMAAVERRLRRLTRPDGELQR